MSTPGHQRVVSTHTRNTLAIIMAGGRGSRLKQLTDWRAKPAVHFGGKFRIIDFPLSNCVNSGIRSIAVLTQYMSHSLIRHVQQGWNFMRNDFGEFMDIVPAQQRTGSNWYAGTADAVYQNLDIIRQHNPRFVVILAGDHIYKMDYGEMIACHVNHDADMTVGCLEVSLEEAKGFGVMNIDPEHQVVGFVEKPTAPEPMPGQTDRALASMGIYVFNTDFLYQQLLRDADDPDSSHDFGKDIIPYVVDKFRVIAYPFRDPATGEHAYWRDVGTVDAFWKANMELAEIVPPLNLYDDNWPIWTHQAQLPPAKFVFDDDHRRGMAVDSMVSGGCLISGATIRHSLLFSNVKVHSYAEVCNSVILPQVDIARNVHLHKVVVDKGCKIPAGMVIGKDPQQDRDRGFHVSEGGVTLVTPEMLGLDFHHVS